MVDKNKIKVERNALEIARDLHGDFPPINDRTIDEAALEKKFGRDNSDQLSHGRPPEVEGTQLKSNPSEHTQVSTPGESKA